MPREEASARSRGNWDGAAGPWNGPSGGEPPATAVIRSERVGGTACVTVDGRPLDWRRSLQAAAISSAGIEWGPRGAGPFQFALAILLTVTTREEAVEEFPRFRADCIARIDEARHWTLTMSGIDGGAIHTVRFAQQARVPVWVTFPTSKMQAMNRTDLPEPQQGTWELLRAMAATRVSSVKSLDKMVRNLANVQAIQNTLLLR